MVGPSRPQMSFGHGGWGAILSEVYGRKDAAVQPSLVVVYFGGNDSMAPHASGLGPHVPLPEYIDNMKMIT